MAEKYFNMQLIYGRTLLFQILSHNSKFLSCVHFILHAMQRSDLSDLLHNLHSQTNSETNQSLSSKLRKNLHTGQKYQCVCDASALVQTLLFAGMQTLLKEGKIFYILPEACKNVTYYNTKCETLWTMLNHFLLKLNQHV